MTEETVEPRAPEVEPRHPPEPMTLKIQRWPVKERKVDASGRLVSADHGYVRTKHVQEEREVEVVAFLPTRVRIYFGTADYRWFGLKSGRCIGIADWVLSPLSHLNARKVARALFPRKRKGRDAAPANDI